MGVPWDEHTAAQAAVADRTTSAATLQAIAQAYPDLRAQIAGHPNTNARLLFLLDSQGDPLVSEAVTQRLELPRQPKPPPVPVAPPRQDYQQSYSYDDEDGEPTGDQQQYQYDDDNYEYEFETPPPQPSRRRRHRTIAIIVTAVALVVAGLVAWQVALQSLKTTNDIVGPADVPGQPNIPRVIDAGMRAPDISSKPSSWVSGIKLTEPAPSPSYQFVDTGSGAIVVIASQSHLQAVDLDLQKTLWSAADYSHWLVSLDNETGIAATDDGRLAYIGVRTGQVTLIGTLPPGESVIYANGATVITQLIDDAQGVTTICARRLADLSECQWQGDALNWNAPIVFGNGKWANTSLGVFNVATGKLAPFGLDAAVDDKAGTAVFYAGTKDGIARFSVNKKGDKNSFQIWDVQRNKAISGPVALKGATPLLDQAAPWLLEQQAGKNSTTIIQAYSWATGERLWQTTLKLSGLIRYSVYPAYSEVWVTVADPTKKHNPLPSDVINNETGKVLWSGKGFNSFGAGQQAVYMSQPTADSAGDSVIAHDGTVSGFGQLWSMKAPVPTVQYYALANHVVAFSQTQGQVWVL